MKIAIPENLNPIDAIRRCGYGLVMDRRAEQASFSRRLGGGIYPRFHAYINGGVINLHLDQKQASYEGYSAHSGEYEGDAVEREARRIQETLQSLAREKISPPPETEEKKGFFGRIFG